MKREIIEIDDEKCTGCGLCIPNCHEGALQIIDGKARLVSELMCDGLGACVGYCPEDALKVVVKEADAYDEVAVISDMVSKGKNTIIAHLIHLKEHNELGYLKQGVEYLKSNADRLNFDLEEVIDLVHHSDKKDKADEKNHHHAHHHHHGGGCPSANAMTINREVNAPGVSADVPSQLTQWPVQMHLINPSASYFHQSDLVLAADCVAFSYGNFHNKFLKGKSIAIACPKLDEGIDVYVEKLISLIDDAKVNTIHVVVMQVPCCSGLLQIARAALSKAKRKVPVKSTVVSLQGEILKEEWV